MGERKQRQQATADEARPAAADGSPAERRSAEAWAEEAGHLPMWLQETTVAARLNPAYWKYTATKALMGWQDGALMTREEYEAAVAKQLEVRHG